MDLIIAATIVLTILLAIPEYSSGRARRLARDLVQRDLAQLDADAARSRRIRHIYATYVA